MNEKIVNSLHFIGVIIAVAAVLIVVIGISYSFGRETGRQEVLDKYQWELNTNGMAVLAPIEK